jgi:hypothetical protein
MPEKAQELERVWQRQTDEFTELAQKTLAEQPAKKKGKNRAAKK